MPPSYVELRAHSAFSFGDGAATPEALVARAAELGYAALGLTDTADLGGAIRFALEAERQGLKPIVGAELIVDGHPAAFLARDEEGCRNLAGLVTRARVGTLRDWDRRSGARSRRGDRSPSHPRRGQPSLTFGDLAERSGGLHALTGPAAGEIASLLRARRPEEAAYVLSRWRDVFGGRLAVEVQLHHVSGAEAVLAAELIALARRSGVPWVVANDARYLDDGGRLVHDLLTALRAGLDVDTAARQGVLHPNGEWRLKSPRALARLWRGREEGLEESARIAAECGFDLHWLRPPLPEFPLLPAGHDDDSYLRERVYAGARDRWGDLDARERERRQLEHELGVIERLGFAGFFLVMWEAVRFARERGILCQGRGSAANSAVAYALGITAVDPVAHDLLFERFLSEVRTDGRTVEEGRDCPVSRRSEPPDIDVDFEMHRREEVLDHVYGLYGRERAAITCVTQTYHAPSALQDVMRALGWPAELAFRLSKRLRGRDPAAGAELLERGLAAEHGLDPNARRVRALIAAMRALDGLPRLRSTHPGGFVLSSGPLGDHMPIEQTTMGRTIVQFDKDDLDAAGVPKFDFLGLGSLSAIHRSFDAIERRTGERLELYRLPTDDRETFELIARGDTVGTFQIESRAQISSILETQPERLYDLVVQVALVRPGPIQARFVHPYTRRRRGLEPVRYAHPALEPILERTYGIPIFQEQAMAISMALGDFSAAEADELRRAMGHIRKLPRLQAALERLRVRLVARGLDEAVARGMVQDLLSFANYGFPESHAWSFALIAYATAYLKTHYPAEFFLGLLNAWPMGFYPPATLVHDARRRGVEVRGPCLKHGEWECTLEEVEPAPEADVPSAACERLPDAPSAALRRQDLGPGGGIAGPTRNPGGGGVVSPTRSGGGGDLLEGAEAGEGRRWAVGGRGPVGGFAGADGKRPRSRSAAGEHPPALRIGWRYIRGLGEHAREALQAARAEGPFTSIDDVVRRAHLSRADALHLARAGAFEAFEPGRRKAAWEALRVAGDTLPLAPARPGRSARAPGGSTKPVAGTSDGPTTPPAGTPGGPVTPPAGTAGGPTTLPAAAERLGSAALLPFDPRELEGEELIFLDYLATGISVHGHPMEHLRARLRAAGVVSSRGLAEWDDGAPIVVAGLVVARQHPGTAKGTVFVLLEDEYGFINVIVPARLYRRNREVVKFSPFLLVEGRFEREGRVMNVVGRRFRKLPVGKIAVQSHDFH